MKKYIVNILSFQIQFINSTMQYIYAPLCLMLYFFLTIRVEKRILTSDLSITDIIPWICVICKFLKPEK